MMDSTSLPEALAPLRGQVLPTHAILGAGVTRSALAGLCARGALARMRDGWYWLVPPGKVWPEAAHRAKVTAALRAAEMRGTRLVLAGASAAVWLGLPWVGRPPDHVIVAAERHAGHCRTDTLRRIGGVRQSDIVVCRDAYVTNPVRTVVDVARLHPGRTALAVGDAAARRGWVTPQAAADFAAAMGRVRGIEQARWCAAHIDGRAESAGESLSRYEAIRAGIAPTGLQCEFVLPNGSLARVDMHWDARRPRCGEYDGKCKYGRENPWGEPPAEVVYREKLREDGLRELGQEVSRWCWADVWNPGAWTSRLRAQLLG